MKEKKGIAVGYSFDEPAPEILAVAKGFLVDRMLAIAKENNITVYKDSDLAEILSYMTPGEHIPDNRFRIMSEILAYCYKINEKFREKMVKSGI
ncbi:MAG: EscU/YscU/HrcU family type III secretion system export apparatus switch protein [Spirochaetes bacterium]|nr:EscU/YscU/HrcU family type III secretion system export apparatus switch protein [Spirochaetota bacterium]